MSTPCPICFGVGGDPWDSSGAYDDHYPHQPRHHNATWWRFAVERYWGPGFPSTHLERHHIEILNVTCNLIHVLPNLGSSWQRTSGP